MSTDIAWLAGIIDGEGSITAQVVTKRDGAVRLTPFVCIVNTDAGIMDKCKRILRDLGVEFHTYRKPAGAFHSNLACEQLRVDGGKRLKVLLPLIMPHLASVKLGYAALVLEFIKLRETALFSHDERGHIRRRPYTRQEVDLIAGVRTHARAKSAQELYAAPNVIQ